MRGCSFPPKRSRKSSILPARARRPSSSTAPLPAFSRCRARNIWPSPPARPVEAFRVPPRQAVHHQTATDWTYKPGGLCCSRNSCGGGARLRGTSDTAPVMNPEPVSDGCATLLELAACRSLPRRFVGDGLRRREGCSCLDIDKLSYVYVRTNKSNRLKTLVAK